MNDTICIGQTFEIISSPVKNILKDFVILHKGWEMDNIGWIVELENGERKLVLTNHGSSYVADIKELEKKIKEYERLTASDKDAIGMMSNR